MELIPDTGSLAPTHATLTLILPPAHVTATEEGVVVEVSASGAAMMELMACVRATGSKVEAGPLALTAATLEAQGAVLRMVNDLARALLATTAAISIQTIARRMFAFGMGAISEDKLPLEPTVATTEAFEPAETTEPGMGKCWAESGKSETAVVTMVVTTRALSMDPWEETARLVQVVAMTAGPVFVSKMVFMLKEILGQVAATTVPRPLALPIEALLGTARATPTTQTEN
mmetsp:Transcript_23032/g.64088  ORF Transcript_23032/g.64088 Transcript_23032/m.64088 type:complete len:231 (-) Transcript_23032:945-1637(-)